MQEGGELKVKLFMSLFSSDCLTLLHPWIHLAQVNRPANIMVSFGQKSICTQYTCLFIIQVTEQIYNV